jgi:hypothetical protein
MGYYGWGSDWGNYGEVTSTKSLDNDKWEITVYSTPYIDMDGNSVGGEFSVTLDISSVSKKELTMDNEKYKWVGNSGSEAEDWYYSSESAAVTSEDSGYKWFEAADYGFKCPYHAEFELAYEPDYYRFMCATFTDGFTSIYFDVSSTNIYANGEEARDSYLSEMSGNCMYTATGDDWFAINNDNENGTITYVKGFVRYGYISTMTFS